MLDDLVLGPAALVQFRIKRAVHGEDVGGEIEHERVRALGDEVDGQVVDHPRPLERLEQGLEVGALLQPIEGPHHVLRRKRAAGVEMHAFAQVEARGAGVDHLPALGQPRLEREILAEADQRIEQQMGELERGAGELLMRVERGGIGVIGHAQRFGLRTRDGGQGEKRDNQERKRPTHEGTLFVI